MAFENQAKQYSITYNKTSNVYMAIIFPSLTIVPLFLLIAFKLPTLPDWGLISLVSAILAIAIAFTLYMVKRISPKGMLTLNDTGFVIEFFNKDMFTPGTIEITTNDITNFYPGENNGNCYLNFSTTTKPSNFSISAYSKTDEDKDAFGDLMMAIATLIDKKNETKSESEAPITVISVYQRGWMKVLLVILAIFIIASTIVELIGAMADSAVWVWVVVIPIVLFILIRIFRKK